jgi:protein SCO1/2
MFESPAPAPRIRPLAVIAGLAAAALLGGCSGGSSTSSTYTSAARASAPSGFAGAALPAGIRAPGFTLTDQHGRAVSLEHYRGQVTVIAFLYPTCGPTCILIAQQVRGALDALAHPPPVLFISAEPAADTSANVARFLARTSLAGRVFYLSGTRRRLERLWRSYRITPPGPGPRRAAFERAASVLLLDRAGRERVLFGIEQLTPESLAHDIGKLQAG